MSAVAFRIVKRADGWHVLAESSDKRLGGPYATKAEAIERLRQVEGHAQEASTSSSALHSPELIGEREMARAFSVAVPLRPSSQPADCWDQFAKFGRFTKDDGDGPQEAVFNLENLGRFIDNWARQPHPLWADWNHEVGECLARYDALALVVDGVVLRQVSLGDVPAPPAELLENPDRPR